MRIAAAARRARSLAAPLVVLGGLLLPAETVAHTGLAGAAPAANARLTTPPREVRLTFTDGVEIALSSIHLVLPEGDTVRLGPIVHPADSAQVLVAATGGLRSPGVYAVLWKIAGADGHPISGRYQFTVAPPAPTVSAADTLAGAAPAPPVEHHDPAVFPDRAGFDASSPGYVLIRWLTFVGMLMVIGAVAFREVVLPLAFRRDAGAVEGIRERAASRAARLGIAAAGMLGLAALLRLAAQAHALRGAAGRLDAAFLGALLGETAWGWGWLLQAIAVLLVVAAFRSRGGRTLAIAAAAAIALSASLSGHAAAVPDVAALALLADSLHLLGAGAWIGGLLLLLSVGLPATRKLQTDERGPAAAALVNAFSTTAVISVTVVVLTGAFAAWLHVGGVALLWQSGYGRTLLLKLAVLSAVLLTGLYNWKKVRPAVHTPAGVARLRRSASAELAIGAVVLLITAVLVAVSPGPPQ